MQQPIQYNNQVIIGYADAALTQERMRRYPTDEASYYQATDEMIQAGLYWQSESMVDDGMNPYQRWQMEKYGNVLDEQKNILPAGEEFENRYLSIDAAGRMIEQHFEMLLDDHWGY